MRVGHLLSVTTQRQYIISQMGMLTMSETLLWDLPYGGGGSNLAAWAGCGTVGVVSLPGRAEFIVSWL